MVDEFVNDVLKLCESKFNNEQLNDLKNIIIATLNNYDISKKTTDIVKADNFVPKCLSSYLMTRKMEGVTKGTLGNYNYIVRTFFNTVQKPLEEITSNDIRAFLFMYKEKKNVTNNTLDTKRVQLCTFFKWCSAEGYIEKDISCNIKPIKHEIKQRGHLSDLEIELLRESCKTLREKAIFEVLYSTGCRVSELVGMKKEDVDFNSNEIEVFGKGSKYRNVYLNVKSKLAIQNYLNSRDDNNEYLFVEERKPHKVLTRRTISRILNKLGKTAGIEKRVFPHLIRHTTATHGLEKGMDVTQVQKMLGHVNVATTMIYAEVNNTDIKSKHNKCFN